MEGEGKMNFKQLISHVSRSPSHLLPHSRNHEGSYLRGMGRYSV
jgi:hypothetical protein